MKITHHAQPPLPLLLPTDISIEGKRVCEDATLNTEGEGEREWTWHVWQIAYLWIHWSLNSFAGQGKMVGGGWTYRERNNTTLLSNRLQAFFLPTTVSALCTNYLSIIKVFRLSLNKHPKHPTLANKKKMEKKEMKNESSFCTVQLLRENSLINKCVIEFSKLNCPQTSCIYYKLSWPHDSHPKRPSP